MRNIDYICTLDIDGFHRILCSMIGFPENSIWGQILKSWLNTEVDDEFFNNKSEKQEYINTFNSLINASHKEMKEQDLSDMFEALCKYFEQRGKENV